jgi:integrase
VLTRTEVQALLDQLTGTPKLVALLMYGSGLRLSECQQLRVKDMDLERRQILVRDGKGQKDRVTVLPEKAVALLQEHLAAVKAQHERDLAAGHGDVFIWPALARKYPGAAKAWGWQFVFPARGFSTDPRSGAVRRHHQHESRLQKAIKTAARKGGHCATGGLPQHCAIRLRRTCWSPARTSAPCRNYWAMPTWKRP